MAKVVEFPDTHIIEEEASLWIVRFEDHERPSPKDIAALHQWMARSDKHRDILLRMAQHWNQMDLLTELQVPAAQRSNSAHSSGWHRWSSAPAMAAMLLLLVTALGFWQLLPGPQSQGRMYVTMVGEQSTHRLPDGSILWLNTNSEIEVFYTEHKRQLLLHSGEAHFDVHHDPNRPFEVYAADRMVRAVGTAFSVFHSDAQIKVTVTEGEINISSVQTKVAAPLFSLLDSDQKPGFEQSSKQLLGALVAGQSTALPHNAGTLGDVLDVDPARLKADLAWIRGRLEFHGQTLEEVVTEVSRYTPVKIEITDPELKSLRIGGQFKVGETEALFNVLETGFGVTISRLNDQHIQIYGDRTPNRDR
ncbi:hypothetical protein HBA55_13225 [Pseudomaricurvus alkylphenolicus]|uniref:FecR family protein n=1 Tax=Pseudomaricurvus alkylphenolicus TaxID=1306991 RepID=UPI00141D770A|nr:FecR domain-containing protein [Pseudomaricurvus alkylphenolicus]NIB40556.1 hypothetical protein [Pseudomaricurvus alkylphenolicus]